ncbi:sulfite exporter TauE/SafE family protein [uncultured Agrococcus sp.]|uniref:sulfite exporter TauE/SafE family protein n=1 Tax=uncultured Agrococcus sp. TaxID=382258 RepID=UPI0025EAF318|nr:sulfite exporter TauE/SafE family protein [uncultured Agrococcus sp.]
MAAAEAARWSVWRMICLGLFTGIFSGLFGVGGGIILVPALLVVLGMERRQAAGTSLTAIVPMAAVGVISYGVAGQVDLLAALLIAAGAVIGAQIGALLLAKLPVPVIRWVFIAFLGFVAVDLLVSVPSRESALEIGWWSAAGLAALGLVTGILSSILGVGGGAVVVPALMLFFGSSDLVAKGTSLAMMIPTALSGTIANLRRGNVDLRAGLVIGFTASLTTVLGTLIAQWISPLAGNILFACFILVILVRMLLEEIRGWRRK